MFPVARPCLVALGGHPNPASSASARRDRLLVRGAGGNALERPGGRRVLSSDARAGRLAGRAADVLLAALLELLPVYSNVADPELDTGIDRVRARARNRSLQLPRPREREAKHSVTTPGSAGLEGRADLRRKRRRIGHREGEACEIALS